MKNSKIVKLIAVSLSVLLLVGVSVMISAMADDTPVVYSESTDKLGIASYNLSYKSQTEMAFAVYEELPDVAEGGSREIYLLFFATNPDESGIAPAANLFNNAMARKTSAGTVKIGDVSHLLFYSNGITARNLAKDLFVCPVAVDKVPLAEGEGYTYTYTRGYTQKQTVDDTVETVYEARNCNPVDYARQKVRELTIVLADESLSNADRKNHSATLAVCSSVINYAADALKRIGEELPAGDSTLIVNGGSIDKCKDGFGTISINVKDYPEDATVFLRAEAKNANGEFFIRWEDIGGNTVSTERIFANAPVHNASGYVVYTAIYGSAADSIYSNTIDLENIVTKDADGNFVAVSSPLVENAVDSAKPTENIVRRQFFNSTTQECVMELVNRCRYEENTTNFTGMTTHTLENSSYGSDDLNLKIEATNGANAQTFYNTRTTSSAVEVDIQINDIKAEGNFTRLTVLANGPTNELAYRLYINIAVYGNETDGYTLKIGSFGTSSTSFFNETDNPDATPVTDPALVTGYKLSSLDEIVTIKCEIDDSGAKPTARITADGQLVFTGSGKEFKLNNTTYSFGCFSSVSDSGYAANQTYITSFAQHYHTNILGAITLDNITFFD